MVAESGAPGRKRAPDPHRRRIRARTGAGGATGGACGGKRDEARPAGRNRRGWAATASRRWRGAGHDAGDTRSARCRQRRTGSDGRGERRSRPAPAAGPPTQEGLSRQSRRAGKANDRRRRLLKMTRPIRRDSIAGGRLDGLSGATGIGPQPQRLRSATSSISSPLTTSWPELAAIARVAARICAASRGTPPERQDKPLDRALRHAGCAGIEAWASHSRDEAPQLRSLQPVAGGRSRPALEKLEAGGEVRQPRQDQQTRACSASSASRIGQMREASSTKTADPAPSSNGRSPCPTASPPPKLPQAGVSSRNSQLLPVPASPSSATVAGPLLGCGQDSSRASHQARMLDQRKSTARQVRHYG